jgi:hypothetical protein
MPTSDNGQSQNAAELTPQQIADQIAAQQVGGEPPQLQREYVVQTSTGAVFRGKTQQELIDQLQKSVEHGSMKIRQQEDELQQARSQLEQQAPYVQQFQQQQYQEQQAWTPQRYFELWAQDPNMAEEYRLRANYGVSQAELAEQIRHAYDFTTRVEPEMSMRSWMATSDFPTSNAEEMEKAANAFEQVWNEFYPGDYGFTPQKLEMVHAVALKRGLYQPEQEAETGQINNQQLPQASTPMPTLNTGTTGGPTGQQDVNRMSPEQLRALMEQLR